MVLFIAGSLFVFEDSESKKQEKFEKIYLQYGRLMYSKAMQILGDHSLSEDAVSEAFIRVFKNLHKLEDKVPSPLTASFVVTVVKNVALTMVSKRKEEEYVPIDEDFDMADTANIEQDVISKISAEDIVELLDKLDEPLKQVFLMYYGYDMNLTDVANTLGITNNLAAVRLHRARIKMAKIVSERRS